jgi:predicted XRE-type DNA-binding protein
MAGAPARPSVLGTDDWRIADIRGGRLERFSLERLIRFLSSAGAHVELRIDAQRKGY